MKRLRAFLHSQSGAITITAAIGMVGLIGFVALAVDVGNIALVKNELQNAADAGALAGARALAPYIGSSPVPNWSSGVSKAIDTVLQNSADGQLLKDCTVTEGYWSTATKTMQSTALVPTASDVPAVLVSINKTTGKNGGPLNLFFAPVFGKTFAEISAQAIAFISSPSSLPAGGAFPLAVNRDLVNDHWNDDPPQPFKIGSDYHYPEGQAGQWTSLKQDNNDVPTIRDLINNGSPDPLSIGDQIWIQPGTENTLFSQAPVGKTVMLPVVMTNFDTHDRTPILNFVAFKITDAKTGNKPYVEGHLVKNYTFPQGTPRGGLYVGTILPPKLTN